MHTQESSNKNESAPAFQNTVEPHHFIILHTGFRKSDAEFHCKPTLLPNSNFTCAPCVLTIRQHSSTRPDKIPAIFTFKKCLVGLWKTYIKLEFSPMPSSGKILLYNLHLASVLLLCRYQQTVLYGNSNGFFVLDYLK